jgi:hypothetical protein
VTVTEKDRDVARDAMVSGFNDCQQTNYFGRNARAKCDCDLGAIDGCKARVEAIAKALADARSSLVSTTNQGGK